MTGLLGGRRVHSWASGLRTRWRRRRLLDAYAGVFRRRTGKSVGFTPMIAALEAAERDGVLSLRDGDVVWHWPEPSEDHD